MSPHKVSDPKEYVPLIHCIMASSNPPTAASKCVTDLGIKATSGAKIEACAASEHGENLLHDVGVKTDLLDPALNYVPWLTFNDVLSIYYLCHDFSDEVIPGVLLQGDGSGPE